jgi:hypothetical protein
MVGSDEMTSAERAQRLKVLEAEVNALRAQDKGEPINKEFAANPGDSAAMARDVDNDAQYLKLQADNPYFQGRGTVGGPGINPLNLNVANLGNDPVQMSIMRTKASGNKLTGPASEYPVTHFGASCAWDAISVMEGMVAKDNGTIVYSKEQHLALYNTMNGVVCMLARRRQEVAFVIEKADPTTTPERQARAAVALERLRDQEASHTSDIADTGIKDMMRSLEAKIEARQLSQIAQLLVQQGRNLGGRGGGDQGRGGGRGRNGGREGRGRGRGSNSNADFVTDGG